MKSKKNAFVVILLVFLVILYSLGKQIVDSLQIDYRLDQEAEKLTSLQKKNNDLKKKLDEVESLSFMEKIARDKLNMSRSNETVIVISDEDINKMLSLDKKVEEIKLPNYQGWLRLFWN